MDENPYAAPQVDLVEDAGPRQMNGWTAGHLRLLAWLSLVCALGTLILLGVAVAAGATEDQQLIRLTDWFGVALTLLGCYLLIRLKLFAEARFGAEHLARPIWALVLFSLLIEVVDFVLGDAATEPGWPMLFYFGLIAVLGAITAWYGVRLLKVQNAYPVFRVMGWLDLVGGIMMATIVLMLIGVLPLIAANVALMLVFFRGAKELRDAG
ncbi:hypothetical protein [Metapseudomonas resinovorans]|uniref:Uncharacterized protein n=1 Tax=Metapseudomonas resinovorans NBRC 106553 TaxID=1245471 RepID=S6BJV3_METRE|nr:hypothetical protein [Pseudomonas resinovorans]BAN49479.1 hypothetical protein PCA10_37470 [Pseudomonas resinovorans NBRC 106553]